MRSPKLVFLMLLPAALLVLSAWLLPPEPPWLSPAAVTLFSLLQLASGLALLARLRAELDGERQGRARLKSAARETIDRLRRSAGELSALARQVNASAGHISRSVDEISRGATLQTELVEKTSALIEDMARSIQRASISAEEAARSTREASGVAQSGSRAATEAVEEMRGVFEGVERYTRQVAEFGERTQEIGNIVRVITEVAQQTHLLAINATIEAARAGEAGRGFAVVAEEIRQLAENSSRSAERIAKIVEEATAVSAEAIGATRESSRRLEQGRQHLGAIVEALNNIVAAVTAGSDRVQIISRLAREQIAGAEQSVKAVLNISAVTRRNVESTQAVSRAVDNQSSNLLDATGLAAQIAEVADLLERATTPGDEEGN